MTSIDAVFAKHKVTRQDGVDVLPRSLVLVAAVEAGYHVRLSSVENVVSNSVHKGSLTKEEFSAFLAENQDAQITAEEMADHLSMVCADGQLSRASLQKAMGKAGSSEDGLSNDEVDALFNEVDTENQGSISVHELMSAIYGEEAATAALKAQMAKDKKRRADAGQDVETEEERRAAEQAARDQAAQMEAAAAEKAAKEKERKEREEAQGKSAEKPGNETAKGDGKPVKKEKTKCGC